MKKFSVTITENLHQQLLSHLARNDGQEDLCFATYVPSTGLSRKSAIISSVILPEAGERNVHGNVGFMPQYLERALSIAAKRKEGLVFLHSHPSDGWQGMSQDDIRAETRIAPAANAACNLPLLGMTMGLDGAWSARFWFKDENVKRKYNRSWCETVRVIGKKLSVTFNDFLLPPQFDIAKQLRTISAWGSRTQEDLSRLKIGIVGLGSVGSIVAEILARTGIADFILIDFDVVEEKNLDRLTNIYTTDIGSAKVLAVAEAIRRSASAPKVQIHTCEYSICEQEGFERALDCDILFSCVDRPWPRQVLNFIAYAHLIPVIDGGILVRTNKQNTRIVGADWKAHIASFQRPCLECLGQYKAESAVLEMEGKLDDPEYIKGLNKAAFVDAHENVYAFSSHLASMEALVMLHLFIAPLGVTNTSQQMYHFVPGTLEVEQKACHDNCYFLSVIGKGDFAGITVYGEHKIAALARQARALKRKPVDKQKTQNKPWLRLKKFVEKSKKLFIKYSGIEKYLDDRKKQ